MGIFFTHLFFLYYLCKVIKFKQIKLELKSVIRFNSTNAGLLVQLPRPMIRKYDLNYIVFDYRKLEMRKSSAIDNNGHKISTNAFSINLVYDLLGYYNIEYEDEVFYFTKINN